MRCLDAQKKLQVKKRKVEQLFVNVANLSLQSFFFGRCWIISSEKYKYKNKSIQIIISKVQ